MTNPVRLDSDHLVYREAPIETNPTQTWYQKIFSGFSISSLTPAQRQRQIAYDLEKAENPKTVEPRNQEKMKEATEFHADIFKKKTLTCSLVQGIYFFMNNTIGDFNKVRRIVKDVFAHETLFADTSAWNIISNFRKALLIKNSMQKHFAEKKLSSWKILTYYFLLNSIFDLRSWLDHAIDGILKDARDLKAKQNLPEALKTILEGASAYIAVYNKMIERFTNDKEHLPADKDKCLKYLLENEAYIDGKKQSDVQKDFGNTVTRWIKDVEYFHKRANFFLTRWIDTGLSRFMKRVIKKFVIDNAVPAMLRNTIESMGSSSFVHALNETGSELIQEFLKDLDIDPKLKKPDDVYKVDVADDQLKDKIITLGKHIFTLLYQEPNKTQEELQKNGKKGLRETYIIEPIVVESVISNAALIGYNILCDQKRVEKYLSLIMELMDKIYDEAPDYATLEGQKILKKQQNVRNRFTELKDELTDKLVERSTQDFIYEKAGWLSQNQKTDLEMYYKNIKAAAFENAPDSSKSFMTTLIEKAQRLEEDSHYAFPSEEQLNESEQRNAELIKSFSAFRIILDNLKPKSNGALRKEVNRHFEPILKLQEITTKKMLRIKKDHSTIRALKQIEIELKKLEQTILSISNIALEDQKEVIANSLTEIHKLNKENQYDNIVNEYIKLENHLTLVIAHEKSANLANILLPENYQKSLIHELVQAQKTCLNNPTSTKYQKQLKNAKDKIIHQIIVPIKECFEDDETKINNIMNAIIESRTLEQLTQAEKQAIITADILKQYHKKSKITEQNVLPIFFDNCKTELNSQLISLPERLADLYKELQTLTQEISQDMTKLSDAIKNIADSSHLNSSTNFKDLLTITNAAGITLGLLKQPNFFGLANQLTTKIAAPIIGITAAQTAKKLTIVPAAVHAISKAAKPIARKYVNSAYKLATNQTFYQGLIYTLMSEFSQKVQ